MRRLVYRQWMQLQYHHKLYMRAASCVLLIAAASVSLFMVPPYSAQAQSTAAPMNCNAMLVMPIEHGVISRAFDGPEQPWQSGHRGVDIPADTHQNILAPHDGVISFAGTVGGKSVVTITYGIWRLTFEPAKTDLAVGTQVRQSQVIARVDGHSDHCDSQCLHFGIKTQGQQYLDPERYIQPVRFRLVQIQ